MLPLVGALAARADDTPEPVPPSDTPKHASAYFYGGGRIGLQWANGDPTAYTQAGLSSSGSVEPTSVVQSAFPGETSMETNETATATWWVRHLKSGIAGSWVRAPFGE